MPNPIRITVVIECPGVSDPDSEAADHCVEIVSDCLERSGLDASGLMWWVDDCVTPGGSRA